MPGGFEASLDAETVWFERNAGVTGLRADATPQIAWALRGPGYHFEPSAAWRVTAYELSDTAPGADDSPDRSAPILSLDTGLVFEREAGEHAAVRAHARAAAALQLDPVPRPGRPALVRHGAAGPQPRAALPHQPLRRRRPPRGRQRARRRPHDAAPARRERPAVPDGDGRPALLLRQPARRAARRGARAAQRLEHGRRSRAHGLAELEFAHRDGMGLRGSRIRCAARPACSTSRARTRS